MEKLTFSRLCVAVLCAAGMATASARELYLAPGGTGDGSSIDSPMGDAAEAFAAAQLERGFRTLDFYKSLRIRRE